MKNLFNKNANKVIKTRELNNKSTAIRYINEILTQAHKTSKNGLFRCEIKLNRHQRKKEFKKYYAEILQAKGFCGNDVKILDKHIILKWFDEK